MPSHSTSELKSWNFRLELWWRFHWLGQPKVELQKMFAITRQQLNADLYKAVRDKRITTSCEMRWNNKNTVLDWKVGPKLDMKELGEFT